MDLTRSLTDMPLSTSSQFQPGMEFLQNVKLFKLLNNAAIVSTNSKIDWRKHPSGREIVRQHDVSQDVYIVGQGRVRVRTIGDDGREIWIRDLGVGKIFGDYSAVDGGKRSASVVTLETSTIGRMPRDVFLEVLGQNPEVAIAYSNELVAMIRLLTDRMVALRSRTADVRVRMELVKLAEEVSSRNQRQAVIHDIPTQTELAALVGTQREVVSREFSRLQKAGIILFDGGTLTILDLQVLRFSIGRDPNGSDD